LADTEISAPAPNAPMASSLIAPGALGSGALGAYGPGICFMLLASALFTIGDVIGKRLISDVTVGQLLLIRSAAVLPLLLPLIHRAGWARTFKVERPKLHALRLMLIVAEVFCFYLSIRYLPLADVKSIYQAGPLFVALMAAPLLGEYIGWRRALALAAGFGGVLLVLQPGSAVFGIASLIALTGTLLYASLIITARLLRDAGPLTLITYHTIINGIAGLISIPFGWAEIDLTTILLVMLIGLLITGGHMCVNESVRRAPAAIVSPFNYTSLLWAILFGWLYFNDIPTWPMLIGAAVIVLSGLYVLHPKSTSVVKHG